MTPAIRDWRDRNPDWRVVLDDVIVCPVCGITVRAIADTALLDAEGIRTAVQRYREVHLRAACSDHFWPTEEYWAMVDSRDR
jgi:hypothetical protein